MTLDTVSWAVIIYAVLFLIIIITYYVNVKPNLKNTSGQAELNTSPLDNAISQIVEKEERELVSDSELVAVITAAIYASMGDAVPAGGLVVRSIRKSGKKQWKNA